MGIFDFIRASNGPGINEGVEEYRAAKGAVLLDVRDPEEYMGGYIPGSINIPVSSIGKVLDVIEDEETPIFVYCRSGSRAKRAVNAMVHLGYTNVKNIGGILWYKGPIEK